MWRTADVIIKKRADKNPVKPNSYRPISLLNVLGKAARIATTKFPGPIQFKSEYISGGLSEQNPNLYEDVG